MRVFLAGATGALGRPTTRALVAAGHRVRGVARGPAKADLVRADGGEPVEVSLFDTPALRAVLEGCDAVMRGPELAKFSCGACNRSTDGSN